MEPYKNLSGNSGVRSYESGPDFIRIEFLEGPRYLYTYESAGADNVERMKELASAGLGLATFISQHRTVREGYVRHGETEAEHGDRGAAPR